MRRLTLGLLCATYVCLSLIVSLTLWRNGGGWGAGVAALVGGLAEDTPVTAAARLLVRPIASTRRAVSATIASGETNLRSSR